MRKLLFVAFLICSTSLFFEATAKPLLDTSSKRKQCKIVDAWIDKINTFAGPKVLSRTSNNSEDDHVYPHEVNLATAPMFTDRVFVPTMGKSFFELSDREAQKIAGAIARCHTSEGNYYFLLRQFRQRQHGHKFFSYVQEANRDPRSIESQMIAIKSERIAEDEMFMALKAERAEERKKQAVARQSEWIPNLNFAGKTLLKTDAFSIHERRLDNHDVASWCPSEFSQQQIHFSIVLKDHSYRIDPKTTTDFVQTYLEPLKVKLCPNAQYLIADIFFQGVYLNRSGKERAVEVVQKDFSHREQQFARINYKFGTSLQNGPRLEYFTVNTRNRDFDFQTLAGFRQVAKRGFKTPKEYAIILAESKRQKDLKERLGIDLTTREVRSLVFTEKGPSDYFVDRRTPVPTMFAYASVMRSKCMSSTPGGMKLARYTSTRNGFQTANEEFWVPADLFDVVALLVRTGRVVGPGRNSPITSDFEKIVAKHGCESEFIRNAHSVLVNTMYEVF